MDMNLVDKIVVVAGARREALPHTLARGGGAVVMIGSVNATLPEPDIVDHSATKAALASSSRSANTTGADVRVDGGYVATL